MEEKFPKYPIWGLGWIVDGVILIGFTPYPITCHLVEVLKFPFDISSPLEALFRCREKTELRYNIKVWGELLGKANSVLQD